MSVSPRREPLVNIHQQFDEPEWLLERWLIAIQSDEKSSLKRAVTQPQSTSL